MSPKTPSMPSVRFTGFVAVALVIGLLVLVIIAWYVMTQPGA